MNTKDRIELPLLVRTGRWAQAIFENQTQETADQQPTTTESTAAAVARLQSLGLEDSATSAPPQWACSHTLTKPLPHQCSSDLYKDPIWIHDRRMPETDNDSFSLLSWNILADVYAQENIRFYEHALDATAWSHRRPLIMRILVNFMSDIVCLQEMMYGEFEWFQEQLAGYHYKGVMQLKDQHRPNHHTGNAIFYRADKFTLAWEQDRSRVLPIGLTRVSASQHSPRIYIANVHLEGLNRSISCSSSLFRRALFPINL